MPRGAARTAGVLAFSTVNDCLGTGGSVHLGVHVHTGGSRTQARGFTMNPHHQELL